MTLYFQIILGLSRSVRDIAPISNYGRGSEDAIAPISNYGGGRQECREVEVCDKVEENVCCDFPEQECTEVPKEICVTGEYYIICK